MKSIESSHFIPAEALTFRAQEIIKKETGNVIPWRIMADAIYTPLHALAATLSIGDTVELPNGLTLTVTFKPKQN